MNTYSQPRSSGIVTEVPTSQMARDAMEDFAYHLWARMEANRAAGETYAAELQEGECARLFELIAAYDQAQ
jgi:hypothetical protein